VIFKSSQIIGFVTVYACLSHRHHIFVRLPTILFAGIEDDRDPPLAMSSCLTAS